MRGQGEHDAPNRTTRTGRLRGGLRLTAAIVVALAVAFVAWLLLREGDAPEQRAPAAAVSAAELRALAGQVGHPIFWAGTRPPGESSDELTYELTRTSDGATYIRYLPPGVEAGANRPEYLTVATYLDARAHNSIATAADRPGTIRLRGPHGRLAVASRDRPQSVFMASPSGEEQIEVFAPDPDRARRVAAEVQRVR
jgi:hypothetical protein